MTPDQLAKSGSEHGVQRALFAWIRWAEAYGFDSAWNDESYSAGFSKGIISPVPELRWCHAIPNGGLRDKITAGKMKQEGALTGILDIHLPLPVYRLSPGGLMNCPERILEYAGLYIEMKRDETLKEGARKALIVDRAAGTTSGVQDEFISYARRSGYAVFVCFDWRSAANDIQQYVEFYRRVNGPLTL